MEAPLPHKGSLEVSLECPGIVVVGTNSHCPKNEVYPRRFLFSMATSCPFSCQKTLHTFSFHSRGGGLLMGSRHKCLLQDSHKTVALISENENYS